MMTPAKPPDACDNQLMEIKCCKENTGGVKDLPF